MKTFPVSCAENIASGKTLTVIVPLRVSHARQDAFQRLVYIELDSPRPEEVEILVVDDGSDADSARLVRKHCHEHGYAYLRVESETLPMAIGRWRNIGAMYARSPFILFQDVDLMPCPGFYSAILREIDVRELRRKNDDFLMCGYIFLTEAGTREFLGTEQDKRLSYFLHRLFENDTALIEKFSNGTPACVYSRYYYLARGGNDPAFANWGYEDLEFNTRLIHRLNKFPLPPHWEHDYRNFNTIIEYRGWKAPYCVFR